MLGGLAAFGVDTEQAGNPQLAAKRLDAQLFVASLGKEHDVERLKLAKTASRTCRLDQQVEVAGVELHFPAGRDVAVHMAIGHATALCHRRAVGDIEGAVGNVNLQIAHVHVKILAANT